MMQHEFEAGVGESVPPDVFEHVNDVYMRSSFFHNKEQVYSFWRVYGLDGFERLYGDVVGIQELERIIKKQKAKINGLNQIIKIIIKYTITQEADE